MFSKIGDSITARSIPGVQLRVLAVAGGRIAVGSPSWPRGANYPLELNEILEINGVPCALPHREAQDTKKRRANRRTRKVA